MKTRRLNSFKKAYKKLPKYIQKQLEQKLKLLIENPRHPSLRARKTKGIVKGYKNLFEGRIDGGYRFLFRVEGDTYVLVDCGEHDQFFK